jgi:hypothetical protein
MAFLYIAICACDFIIFPILWTAIHTAFHTGNYVQWQPLTLQGGGLIHLAFGAILGFYSWGRTREKIAAMSYAYSDDSTVQEQEDVPVVRPQR